MASIHNYSRGGKPYSSGDLYAGVNNTLVRTLKYTNESIEPGMPAIIQSNGEIISSSAKDGNQVCVTADYNKRVMDASPKGWPCHFGGIIFTNRPGLNNAGDILGNMVCLGSIDTVINNKTGSISGTSTVSLVLKRSPGKNPPPYGNKQ